VRATLILITSVDTFERIDGRPCAVACVYMLRVQRRHTTTIKSVTVAVMMRCCGYDDARYMLASRCYDGCSSSTPRASKSEGRAMRMFTRTRYGSERAMPRHRR